MAGLESGDRPGDRAINGQQDNARGRPGLLEDEQTLADSDQTLSDGDQTSSDGDQTSSDGDQSSADRDQSAADRDQAASDRDLAAGGNPAAHQFSRDVRDRTARERDQSARSRLQIAAERDAVAQARDLAARARDVAAGVRDRAMAELDASSAERDGARAVTGAEVVIRAGALRARAAAFRARAAEHRVLAAEDRAAAAREREQAERDRVEALADRELLARALAVAETDALTGARTRSAGLADLERELDRCRRTSATLTVCYVDVVGVKAANDTDGDGHTAGDALLKDAVAAIRAHLRSYDVIIRVGGDEFVCAMPNMTSSEARERFSHVAAALTAAGDARAIRTGFAQLAASETASTLIDRADHDLITSRG